MGCSLIGAPHMSGGDRGLFTTWLVCQVVIKYQYFTLEIDKNIKSKYSWDHYKEAFVWNRLKKTIITIN